MKNRALFVAVLVVASSAVGNSVTLPLLQKKVGALVQGARSQRKTPQRPASGADTTSSVASSWLSITFDLVTPGKANEEILELRPDGRVTLTVILTKTKSKRTKMASLTPERMAEIQKRWKAALLKGGDQKFPAPASSLPTFTLSYVLDMGPGTMPMRGSISGSVAMPPGSTAAPLVQQLWDQADQLTNSLP